VKLSPQFSLWTIVCGVGAIAAVFATMRIAHTIPYWSIVPTILLIVSMRSDMDHATSLGMIALAMLVASLDHCWRLPNCFGIMGFLHRHELQTRIADLYITSFAIPFSLGIPAIICTLTRTTTQWSAAAKWNMIAAFVVSADVTLMTLVLYVTAAFFSETMP